MADIASLRSVDPIEVADGAGSDADSGYDDKTLSTASVTSSIYNFKKENGRTYHAYKQDSKAYALPNDEAEQERMDIHYHSLRLTLGDKLYFAPLEHPASAIDIGTGTGIWAMDMADAYPACEVLGVDLSPIQPGYVPPNCSFHVMDLDDEWDMPGRFELVHTREMNGFAVKDWRRFYEQAFMALKPGGWVESQEFDLNISSDDGTIPENSKTIEWQSLWEKGVQLAHMTGRCDPEKMKEHMEAVGFVNITILPFKMPLGVWPKDKVLQQSGLFTLVGLLDGISGLSVRVFTQLLGWSVEEMEVLLGGVRKEMKNKKIHSYFPIYVVYGQKPPAS